MTIHPAHENDLVAVRELLGAQHLPLDGVDTTLRTMVDTAFLLTTTAEAFFPRLGFERIARAEVPESVQASIEFQSARPDSAVAMRKRLA